MRRFLVLALFLGGCTWISQRKALATCDFYLHSVKLSGVGIDGFEMEITLRVRNPNPVDAVLDRIDYTVSLEGVRLAQGYTEKTQRVKARSTGYITTRLKVLYDDIPEGLSAVISAVKRGRGRVGFVGQVHFDTPIGEISQDVALERTLTLER